jgi:kinesin family protein 3/17
LENCHFLSLSDAICTGGRKEFLVRASYLEIYNEEIRDLLSKNPQARLDLKEHPERGVYVKDLMQFVVKSVAEINSVLQVRSQRCGSEPKW